jgi:Tfp pilus assembly protein PilV
MHARTRDTRGFTLMEMIIAFMLTLVAVLSLVSVFPTGIQSVQGSSDSLEAQTIAQWYLDYIREFYQINSDVPPGFGPGTTITVTPPSGTLPNSSSDSYQQFRGVSVTPTTYSLSYTEQNVATGSTPEHLITLTVTWTGVNGSHTRSFQEYVEN